jgi:hypothetical protein
MRFAGNETMLLSGFLESAWDLDFRNLGPTQTLNPAWLPNWMYGLKAVPLTT